MNQELNNCKLCNSGSYIVIDKEVQTGVIYTIAKCRNCSAVFVPNKFSPISPDYINFTQEQLTQDHIWLQSKHKELAFSQSLRLINRWLIKKNHIDSKRVLLDVGCGIGGWLSYVGESFNCFGFDASKVQVEYAAKSFPNVCHAVSIEEYKNLLPIPLPNIDVITMWDVLEHIRNPIELMTSLAKSLTESGLIYVSVPAAFPMELKSRMLKVGWPRSRFSWSPQEHVIYYSPKTLKILCEKSGMTVIKIGSVPAYQRKFSIFELIRRCWFRIAAFFPSISPQIYFIAKKKATLL